MSRHIAQSFKSDAAPIAPKDRRDMPTDALGMLRRIYRQDGKMTTDDWARLCDIVRSADESAKPDVHATNDPHPGPVKETP